MTRPSPPARDESWEALLAAALDDDKHAYRRLLGEMTAWLRNYYARRLPPGMIEDAAQEALIAIHDKRHTHEPGRPVKPWAAAIARYKWIDRLRAMRRDEELHEEKHAIDDHESAVTSAIVLERLMKTLKPAQAKAIRLVKIQGFSIAEASNLTGQSESLVKVNIFRGMALLTREVERSDEE